MKTLAENIRETMNKLNESETTSMFTPETIKELKNVISYLSSEVSNKRDLAEFTMDRVNNNASKELDVLIKKYGYEEIFKSVLALV